MSLIFAGQKWSSDLISVPRREIRLFPKGAFNYYGAVTVIGTSLQIIYWMEVFGSVYLKVNFNIELPRSEGMKWK